MSNKTLPEPIKTLEPTPAMGQVGQLALSLFQDFPEGIQYAPKDVGYSKPKTLIQVSSVSLLARRALNACYFLVSDTTSETDIYTVNLAYFKWLIGFDSRNSMYLKKALTECQQSAVSALVADPRSPAREAWVSVPLIGKVGVSGGQLMFYLDPTIKKLIKNPDQFSYLSLRILAAFTSQYALELYEKLLPYLEQGVTPWIRIEDIDKEWIELKGEQTEFKYINRDVLTPAITQINKISNIFVELDTRKAPGSRKVAEIRFIVRENPDGEMVIGADKRAKLKELHEILTDEFGLSPSQLDAVANSENGQSIEKLWSAVEYTRSRIEGGAKIGVPAKYLLAALDGGWSVPKARDITGESARIESKPKALRRTAGDLDDAAVAEQISAFFASFLTEGGDVLLSTWRRFLASTQGKLLANNVGGLSLNYERELKSGNAEVTQAFAKWLQKQKKST